MLELSKLRLILVGVVALVASIASQNTRPPSAAVPKYDLTTEVRIQGVVVDTNDHECPISGVWDRTWYCKPKMERLRSI